AECAAALWREIGRASWDQLELVNLAAKSALLRTRIVPAAAHTFSRTSSPIANIRGGFEAYLQRLSSNGRQQARRLLREGERAGVRFEIAEPHERDEVFGDLIRLHQARWNRSGKSGVFAAHRFVEFHRRLTAHWMSEGRAVLARLLLGRDPVAVL